jgi:hypothetical protein
MSTIDFLPFANDAASANVVSQADYLAAATGSGYVQNGFPSGRADSNKANKVLRQSSVMTAALAQFIAAETGQNVLDSGGASAVTALTSQFLQAMRLACLPNGTDLYWDTTNHSLTITGNSSGWWPQLYVDAPNGFAGIAMRGNASQSMIMHYGESSSGNELRFARASNSYAWAANPIRFDMDAPEGSLVVDGAGTIYFGSNKADSFPSGTAMLFLQAAAPTGWTKSTTHNNKMLRIVSSSGGGSGGSAALSTAWSSVALSGTVAGHTLTSGEIPSHTHSGTTGGQSATHSHSYAGTHTGGGGGQVSSQYFDANNPIIMSGNASNDHTHTITTDGGTGGGGSHGHGLTVNAFTVTPAYVDAIICVKT